MLTTRSLDEVRKIETKPARLIYGPIRTGSGDETAKPSPDGSTQCLVKLTWSGVV